MITDEKWPIARLIPISSASGVEAQERRLASALLAVMGSVPEFGLALLKPLGASTGKIETFIEVPFKLPDGGTIRPDGVIVVTRGGKTWSAIIEAKISQEFRSTARRICLSVGPFLCQGYPIIEPARSAYPRTRNHRRLGHTRSAESNTTAAAFT